MLIKDPSRFQIRNAHSNDCIQLYQLINQCVKEVMDNGQPNLQQTDLNNNDFNNDDLNNNENDLNNNNVYYDRIDQKDDSLQSFDELIDCLGFGKRGEQRKVLDCLVIEDLNKKKIIALVTYSYSYFSYVGKEIYMNHLYVKPEYRLNGFGRFLMRNLIKLAADAKMNKLKYDAPRTSKDFCKFMKKVGAKDFTENTGYSLFRFNLRTIDNQLNKKELN